MWKSFSKKPERFLGLLFVLLFAGCAVGPFPPVPPDLFRISAGWVVVGFFVWGGLWLWKKLNSDATTKDHLPETLDIINKRLASLEEKIDRLERDDNR